MERKKVSVVIPAYNAASYLKEAIESALAQTYRDYEIIVVDDGSTDETPAIAQGFGDALRYVRQANGGLSSARNTAIRNSCAEIIALLDADDVWEPDYLEIMVSFLEQHPEAGAAYCGFQYINATSEAVGRPSSRVVPHHRFHEVLLYQGNWLVPSAVLFRRKVAERVQLFDEAIGPVADTDLWIRMSAIAPFVGLPNVLVKYRCHSHNMSKNPDVMIHACALLAEKMYGPPAGDPSKWSAEKQSSYLSLYWAGANQYIAYGDAKISAAYFLRLFELSRTAASGIPFWRSIARVHIPLEYQNDPSRTPDWSQAENHVSRLLDEVSTLTSTSPGLYRSLPAIKGMAFVALADEAGRHARIRRAWAWLWSGVKCSPQIIFFRPYWGTLWRSLFYKARRLILQVTS